MRIAAFALIIAAFSIAACGDDTPASPSSSSSTPTRATERFDAIIDVRGSAFFPFSVGQSGAPTSINLASLSPLDRPGVLNVTMEIGWGKTIKDDAGAAIGCDLQRVMRTMPALSAQLTDTLTPASDYCANIADVGDLRGPANFSIRVMHP
jgi:hypothetical protein